MTKPLAIDLYLSESLRSDRVALPAVQPEGPIWDQARTGKRTNADCFSRVTEPIRARRENARA